MKKLSFLLAALFVFAAINVSAQNADVKKESSCTHEKHANHSNCTKSTDKTTLTYSNKVKAKEGENLVLIKADIDCKSCQAKLEKHMSYAKGVKDVAADVETKTVTIAYDPKKVNEATLLKEVKKLKLGNEEIVPVKACGTLKTTPKSKTDNVEKKAEKKTTK